VGWGRPVLACMTIWSEGTLRPPVFPATTPTHHQTPVEIATEWHLTVKVIRELFERESTGVIHINRPETLHKRGYHTMRISQEAKDRVYRRITRGG
jgi:hypothetical protein